MTTKSDRLHKIHLEKEKETLLITLYAKALDSRSKNPILNDNKAFELVEMIDYDFERLNSFGDGNIMVIRAKQFDSWLNQFLNVYPNAVVLNLGCGLDTRVSRINPGADISWFDVDFPEVIELRKRFYSEQQGYKMIASSVNEAGWLESIPKDKPAMIVAEGLLEYLTEAEVKTLLSRLTDHFPNGRIAFDVMNSFAINSGKDSLEKTTGAEHKWAVDNLKDVDKLNGKLRRIDRMSVFRSPYINRLSLKYRLIYALMSAIPSFRNMIRLLLYEF